MEAPGLPREATGQPSGLSSCLQPSPALFCRRLLFINLNIMLAYNHLSRFSYIARHVGEGAGKRKPHPALFPEIRCLSQERGATFPLAV